MRKRRVKRRQMHNRFQNLLNSINNETSMSDEELISSSSSSSSSNEVIPSTKVIIIEHENQHLETDEVEQNNTNVSNIPHQSSQNHFDGNILHTQNNDLAKMLQNWVLSCHPHVSHVDLLLSGLNKFTFAKHIPKTYASLMNTPKKIMLRECSPGQYYHVGVKKAVTAAIKYYSPNHCGAIVLDINIDGLPLYKTTSNPIVAHIRTN